MNMNRILLALSATLMFHIEAKSQADLWPEAVWNWPVDSSYFAQTVLLVDKSARELALWKPSTPSGQVAQKSSFPADMGARSGSKMQEGDKKTPDGIYFLMKRLVGQQLDFSLYGKLALTMDYPNFFDELENRTGYGIWLHGVPDTVPLTRGSRGCVVVRNQTLTEIDPQVDLGKTPIVISPKQSWVPATEAKKNSGELKAFLARWQKAWSEKDIKTYIDQYSDRFTSLKMNRSQWEKYKSELATKYEKISVELGRPFALKQGSNAIVKVLQRYKSDLHVDLGIKTLFLEKRDDSKWVIVGEQWQSITEQAIGDLELKSLEASITL